MKRYSLAYRGRKNASGSAVSVKMVINESHKLQLQRISIPLIAPIPQIGTDDDTDFDQESRSLFFDSIHLLSSSSETYKSRQEKSMKPNGRQSVHQF